MPRAKKRPCRRPQTASISTLGSVEDGLVSSLKDSSTFWLKVHRSPHSDHDDPVMEVISLLSEGLPLDLNKESKKDLRLYINADTPGQSFLFNNSRDYYLLRESSLTPQNILTFRGLHLNKAGLILMLKKGDGQNLTFHVVFCSTQLKRLEHPSQLPGKSSWASRALSLRYFTEETLPLEPELDEAEDNLSFKPDIDALYDALKTHHASVSLPLLLQNLPGLNPQHGNLKPELRPYQRNAVLWMISQERLRQEKKELHPLYVPILDYTYYLNREGGFVVKEFPGFIPRSPGGILADEMGLGKTVEILSLILCAPRNDGLEGPPPALEPVTDIRESKKRRSRRREASPVEFDLGEEEADTEEGPIPQVDGGADESDETDDFIYNSSDFDSCDDDEDYQPQREPKPSTSSSTREKREKKKQKEEPRKEDPPFDPIRLLSKKTVTPKSTLQDLILTVLIKLGRGDYEFLVSGASIKKALEKDHNKSGGMNNKRVNKVLTELVRSGTLLSTSPGAAGSFCFNVRGEDPSTLYKAKGVNKPPSVYSKLKAMYDIQLGEMSMTEEAPLREADKRWRNSYFDTKVDQKDFFECICGADEFDDDLSRVQCSVCTIRQHAECVKYDLRNPFRGEYKCPHCWSESEPVPSKGTLIVSPDSISYQWIQEMQKHARGLRVLYYKGTKVGGYIQPVSLGSYDVVVTTYSVLSSETNHLDLPYSNSVEGRKFRNPKRFMAIPAPLPSVQWWRVCLDEAQMIEGNTISRTAEMALRLSCVNKWAVTGTPIGKSVNDLYGLFLFLGYDPYSVNYWWRVLVYESYVKKRDIRALEELLAKVMWRTAKRDVLNQISIPPQTEQIHWLSFSPIEEYFYRRQHIDSSTEIVTSIRKLPNHDLKLSEVDRNTISSILRPMLKLRQSCCHPQVVKGVFLPLQSSSITMEELLNQMIKKNTMECEENHRAYISSLNGIAGLHIIEEDWTKAVDVYREALGVISKYEERIKTDTLQLLHTLANLGEVLEAKHEGIAPTLRDDFIPDETKKLKDKYLIKYSSAVASAGAALSPASAKVETLLSEKSSASSEPWYVEAINAISSSSEESALLKLVKEEMAQFYDVVHDREFKEISEKFSSSRIILYKIVSGVTDSDKARGDVLRGIGSLKASPLESFVSGAVDCHLRVSSAGKKKALCRLCAVHNDIEVLEKAIFHFVKGELKSKSVSRSALTQEQSKKLEDAGVFLLQKQRVGNWTESQTERLIRAVLKYLKGCPAKAHYLIEEGVKHLNLIEATKKEFKLIRILWRQVHDMVAAMDELNMCVMRLRLRFDDEPDLPSTALKRKRDAKATTDLSTREKDKYETIYIIEKHEIPSQRLKLMAEKTVAHNEFKKKYGQLLYLENLKKTDFKENGGENPEPCPICQKELGHRWSVLQCGHSYCEECIGTLINEYSSSNRRLLQCPMCRSMTNNSEISYVNTKSEQDFPKDLDEKVKGSLSTKVEAIVKTLFSIEKSDPQAKSLIFSTWTDLLDIVGVALLENNIPFAALHAHGKFKRNLQKFKNRVDVKVLLLPISSGANGLNLIEASHVFLVEPLLNPAQELQAIGRVHRIGQKKPTVVHRFLIRGTVEERMHDILGSYQRAECEQGSHSTEENLITLKDLRSIFNDNEED